MVLIEAVIALVTLVILVVIYFKQVFRHWDKLNVVYVKPTIPFGSFGSYSEAKKGIYVNVQRWYLELKARKVKYGGVYLGPQPILMILDVDLIKNIFTRDFQYFASHGTEIEAVDPILAHLFNLSGKEWKDMRVKLTPTFTSGKMKMMFNTFLECGHQLSDYLDETYKEKKPLDVKEIMACFTTDIIGCCAFGIECNSFKNPDAEFRKYGRKIFESSFQNMLKRLLPNMCPFIVRTLKMSVLDSGVRRFFIDAVENIVSHRLSNNVNRNDFMQILLNMKAQAEKEGERLTMEQITSQALVFFIAGFETSSTTMTFCLYELAHHQEIQDKLRVEINEVMKKHDGKLTYDGVMEMKYLDQVLNETLRKYPPVSIIPRTCTGDYKFEDGVEIKKGTKVFINAFGVHRDEDNFPDPDKFDPDRFSDENKVNIKPYSFIPFGEGPRICIGLRFGMLQAKVGICLLLRNYRVLPHKTLQYPLEIDPKALILSGKGDILMNLEKVN